MNKDKILRSQILRHILRTSALILFPILALALFWPRTGAAVASDELANNNYSENWRATGPTGGDVRALVVDPNDPDRFYFGTLDGQLYTSTDGAETWHLLYNFNFP